jgi:hypothetical protein
MIRYPHRIRLHGPWECEPLARLAAAADGRTEAVPGPLPPPCRLTMPGRWRDGGLGDFAGRVRCRRRFGYPGRIDAWERVWLTCAGVEGVAEVTLNGRPLGRFAGGPFEVDVTDLLGVRNELLLVVEAPAGGGPWGEVALEVRRTAFLRSVRAWRERPAEAARLHVAGEVVGTADRPLELYILHGGANVAYTTVETTPAGQAFHVEADGVGDASDVRVELIDGGVIWYAAECECAP